ncbi:MAG: hypothetical protein NC541_08795 [bacterium]|nr:hypothetical protein [bacterium]
MLYDQSYVRENFKEKLLKAINTKYSGIPKHKRRGKFKDDYCKQASIDRTKFENRFSSWVYRGFFPETENLIIVCNILHCDMDYFLTEQEELRKSVAHAAETTGLDYDTVDKIESYSPEIKQLIDRLVLHTNKDNLLKLLNAILAYSLHSHHAYIKIDVPGADIFETNDIEEKLVHFSPSNPLNDISKKMLKYSVTSSLDEILTDTYNDYIDDGNSLLWERLKKEGEYKKTAVKNAFENRKANLDLTAEDILLIYGNRINNNNPTLDERYNQIDEEITHAYKLYKESSKNSK